jgi:hypothetical protein
VSYNIDSTEIIYRKGFSIASADFHKLQEQFENEGPEISILNCVEDCLKPGEEGRLNVEEFWWTGSGSGRTYELLKQILAKFDGEADIVLTWEGGDSFDGLRLRDHKVTCHEVIMQFGEENT